jgi:hypothetical protein
MSASDLQRRRDQERALHETQSFLSKHQNTQRLHDWEQRTQQQIDQREVNTIAQKLLQREEEKLQQRQQELQSLYKNEMSCWNETRQRSMTVTQEERMEQIRARAYELKERREKERQAFVKECYERQWMESCDDLRALNSKAMLDRLTKDRELIIKNKKRISEEQQKCQAENVVVPSLTDENDGGTNERRRQLSLEYKRALDHQTQWKRSHAESLVISKQLQEKDQLDQLAKLQELEKQSGRELIEKAKEDGKEMLQEMQQRSKERETRQSIERNQNRILLQHVMEEERRQIQMEQAKKELGREIASDFMQCLKDQAKEDERENDYIDRILNNEVERWANLSDEKIAAEMEYKRQWMKEVSLNNNSFLIKIYSALITSNLIHPQVDASWQEQIRRKQIEAEKTRTVMEQEIADVQAALRREAEVEVAETENARAKRIETMMDNKQRIDARLADLNREQQEKYRVQEQIRNEEKAHQRRLEEKKKQFGVRDLI